MVAEIKKDGGDVTSGEKVLKVHGEGKRVTALQTDKRLVSGRNFLFTPAFPIIAEIFEGAADAAWLERLRRVRYLGNMCLVLRMNRSLSDTYWLNVNDPGFPFVGVIEHTNFDSPANYKGSHIAFLSRYLSVEDPVWTYSDEQYVEFALEHLKRMFPELDRSWIIEHKIWRAEYAQPVTERDYSHYVPGRETPFENAYISTMAQIYPEDRGTNYAIREGRSVAKLLMDKA
jgi:protoporphyrinogen oxidase